MRLTIMVIACLLTFLTGLTAANGQGPAPHPTLVLTNGQIYTVNPRQPWAQAVAIDANGVIIAVGSASEVLAEAGPNAVAIDLRQLMVLPGFQDVHLHAVEAGINADQCHFPVSARLTTYRRLLCQCAQDSTGWVVGAGVNMADLLDQHANPVAVLDEVIPERPVLILDDLGHGAWANSRALAAVGYDKLPGNPPGGIIMRDAVTGAANGVVLENAQQKLRDAAFPPTPENLELAYRSLLQAQEILVAHGITSVSDAGGYWPQGHAEAWYRAARERVLKVRASNAFYVYPDRAFESQVAELKRRYQNDPGQLVRFNQAKIYVDGILSQATGALYEPYEAGLGLTTDERLGFLYFEEPTLNRYAVALSQAGFQLHFHATGDRGVGLALNAIEHAASASGPHRITHLYLVDQRDRARFKAWGAVADFQLAPSTIDAEYDRYLRTFIGSRADDLLPARSMLATGARVTLSSDWDADEPSPLKKIQAVLARQTEGIPDLATAIELMTLNPARLLRHADRTGSIEVGKFADLVVLDHNLFTLAPNRIGAVVVRATLLQGEAVYDPSHLLGND